MGAQAQPHVEGVNNVVYNQIWVLGLPQTWIALDKRCGTIFMFWIFKIKSSALVCHVLLSFPAFVWFVASLCSPVSCSALVYIVCVLSPVFVSLSV